MGDHVADLPQYPKREAAGSVAKEDMDAQRFAHISDLTYSAQQVSVGLHLSSQDQSTSHFDQITGVQLYAALGARRFIECSLTWHTASACGRSCFAAHEVCCVHRSRIGLP